MKVLHLISGSLNGGAARGTLPLHHALRRLGVDSVVLVDHFDRFSEKDIKSTEVTSISKFARQLRWHADSLPTKLYRSMSDAPFSTGLVGIDLKNIIRRETPDIVNLHWVNAAFVSIGQLKQLKLPVVWTLRDLWPLTGGCHYPLECTRYEVGCGKCPILGSSKRRDLSWWMQRKKRASYESSRVTFVGISKWLTARAEESRATGGNSIQTIMNCINTDAFYPVAKPIARQALGIPTDEKVLLIGAQNPKDSYKGFESLAALINLISKGSIQCRIVTFGRTHESLFDGLRIKRSHMGFLSDEATIRLAYSAADVFLAPSHQEAFGKTIAESLACGTPAVAFNIGGPSEIIKHKITGYLATPFEPEALLEGILWVLNHAKAEEMSVTCSQTARSEFSPDRAAREYVSLYTKILSSL